MTHFIKVKSIQEMGYSVSLYEYNNGMFGVVKSREGKEIPSLPTKDLNTALFTFDLWLTELKGI